MRIFLLIPLAAGLLCVESPLLAQTARAKAAVPASSESLKPGGTFKECRNCPEMVVVPAGSFVMGSPADEPDRRDND